MGNIIINSSEQSKNTTLRTCIFFIPFFRTITPHNSLEIRSARTYCARGAYEQRVVNVIRGEHVYTGGKEMVLRTIEFLRFDGTRDRCIERLLGRLIRRTGQPYQQREYTEQRQNVACTLCGILFFVQIRARDPIMHSNFYPRNVEEVKNKEICSCFLTTRRWPLAIKNKAKVTRMIYDVFHRPVCN